MNTYNVDEKRWYVYCKIVVNLYLVLILYRTYQVQVRYLQYRSVAVSTGVLGTVQYSRIYVPPGTMKGETRSRPVVTRLMYFSFWEKFFFFDGQTPTEGERKSKIWIGCVKNRKRQLKFEIIIGFTSRIVRFPMGAENIT